jgi:hypothetical protein
VFKSELPVATEPVDGQSTTVSEIENILNYSWRLPDFARNFRYHRGYTDVRGDGVAYAVRWIASKVSIVDPTIKHDFPSETTSLVKGLIHLYRTPKAGLAKQAWNAVANVMDDSKANDFLSRYQKAGSTQKRAFADWFRIGLYEAPTPTVVIKTHELDSFYFNESRNIRFYANVDYKLVLFVGLNPIREAPLDLSSQNTLAVGRVPFDRWFKIGMYVPDKLALRMMDAKTRGIYLDMTGRGIAGRPDTYWRLSGWERALEAAKIPYWFLKEGAKEAAKIGVNKGVGMFTQAAVRPDPPPSRYPTGWREDQLMKDDGAGNFKAGPQTYAKAVWNGRTEFFNRKSVVPPGFCFVKFNCYLNVAVVGVNIPASF